MADIVRAVRGINQKRSRSSSFTKSPDVGIVPSDVANAMDRILSQSPTKLLRKQSLLVDDSVFPVGHKQQPSKVISSSRVSIGESNQTLACTVSNAHITTDTTTTATAIFTDLSTCSSGTKSPIMSSIPAYASNIPSLPASAIMDNIVSEQNGDVAHKPKSRTSRADMNICNQTIVDSPRSVVLEKRSILDTESVSKPEKKKTKKKSITKCKMYEDILKQKLNEKLKRRAENLTNEDGVSDISSGDEIVFVGNNTSPIHDLMGENGNSSHPDLFESLPLTNQTSDNPPSVIIQPSCSFKSQQKLPKMKRTFIHVSKDLRYIRKKLLPCYIVLKKLDSFIFEEESEMMEFNLNIPLTNRIQHLSALCSKNVIECPKRKLESILERKNIFEETQMGNDSGDDFVNPRGRSLRKRNHNVCYVEPSEDDLLVVEFSSSKSNKMKSQQSDGTDLKVMEMKKEDANVENHEISPLTQQTGDTIPVEKTVNQNTSFLDKTAALADKPLNGDVNVVDRTSNNTAPVSDYAMKKHSKHKEKSEKRKSLLKNPPSNKAGEETTSTPVSGNERVNETENNKRSQEKVMKEKEGTQEKVIMKDKEGRSLVYVYPKTSVLSKNIQVKRPGPASKTQKPLNISTSVAPVTTLSLPRSLLSNLVPRSAASITTLSQQASPVLQSAIGSGATSPQFCMVKIDGKDYLVPMLAGNPQATRLGTPSTVTLPSTTLSSGAACRFMLQPLSGLPTSQVVNRPGSTPVSAQQPVAVTRFSTVMLPAGPVSSAVRMISSSQIPASDILSTVPLIRASQVATTTTPTISPQSSTNPSLSAVTTVSRTLPHGSTSLVSLVRPQTISTASIALSQSSSSTPNTSGTQSITTVAPLAAPASTTVLRNNRPKAVTPGTPQLVASSNAATGQRCFRFIVPGCTATGTPTRIATLGTPANSSPLTHMTVSSSLLPQRKRSTDKELSPEKRAAKRRRLEKKYPLPPGVVIKAEPDESPKPASVATVTAGSMRSLLGQNIQLITAASRGGAGTVQNIRIVGPAIGSRQMRLAPNVIIRAPNVGSSGSATSMSALAVSGSGLVLVGPSTQSSTNSTVTLSQALSSISSPRVCSSVITAATPSSVDSNSSTSAGDLVNSLSPSTTTVASASGSHSISSTSSMVSDKITTLSYSVSSTASISSSSFIPLSNASSVTSTVCPPPSTSIGNKKSTDVASLTESIETLRKFIRAQESIGLQGERLKKLKGLLMLKESALIEMKSASGTETAVTGGDVAQDTPAPAHVPNTSVIVID